RRRSAPRGAPAPREGLSSDRGVRGRSAAFGATAERVADLAQQQDLLGGTLRLLLLALGQPLHEALGRRDEHEVHHRGGDDERDDRVDQQRQIDAGGVVAGHDGEADALDGVLAAERVDDRLDHGGRVRTDQRREGGADDDRDGQVDDVPAEQEVLESLKHDAPPMVCDYGSTLEPRRAGCAVATTTVSRVATAARARRDAVEGAAATPSTAAARSGSACAVTTGTDSAIVSADDSSVTDSTSTRSPTRTSSPAAGGTSIMAITR